MGMPAVLNSTRPRVGSFTLIGRWRSGPALAERFIAAPQTDSFRDCRPADTDLPAAAAEYLAQGRSRTIGQPSGAQGRRGRFDSRSSRPRAGVSLSQLGDTAPDGPGARRRIRVSGGEVII